MEQVRSFIAIELPDEVRQGLAQLQTQLKLGEQTWVKSVDPYSIHLTLQFLGNVAANKVDEITSAMEASVRGVSQLELEVGGLGVFPNLKRVQVVWMGIGGEIDKLSRLQKRIESNLIPLGFTPESRPFKPHLTLARLRNQASLGERRRLGQLIADTRFEVTYNMKVTAVNLMRSQLTREGAIYSRISLVSLEKSLPKDAA